MNSFINSSIEKEGFKFEDAIKYFNKKIPLTKEHYKKLDDKYKSLAFTIANYSNINLLNEIFNLGILDGIECVHSKHTKEQVIYLKNFCKENKLLMTGGSDFHDDKKQTLGFTELGEISDEYNFKFAK